MNEHVWWYLARATGIVAWLLATASVLWGMALSTRALGPRPRAPWLLDLHRYLGGLTVLFVVGHLGAIWADSYVDFGPREILVPFASSWRPLAVALGIVALYLLLAVEITSLLRRRIDKRLWRVVHLSSYGVYLLTTLHLIAAGADAVNIVVRTSIVLSGSAVTFFVAYLIVGPGRLASARARSATSESDRRAAAGTSSEVDRQDVSL